MMTLLIKFSKFKYLVTINIRISLFLETKIIENKQLLEKTVETFAKKTQLTSGKEKLILEEEWVRMNIQHNVIHFTVQYLGPISDYTELG